MNRYRLLTCNLVSDVEQFERAVVYNAITSDNVDDLRHMIPLYCADYLEEQDYHWARAKARELRRTSPEQETSRLYQNLTKK
ncbi:hypothetical protein [Paenibacillus xylanexedens]|uniref:hypothetical protein n=1 Tax=Paenibacillus xylanexedens TaxID=528191 RepID=UPI0016435326|nr:hypothetical protein [Paenibacillus xylanexedens]